MPLFGRQPFGSHQKLTINGYPQTHPETAGSMPRRFRFFVEVERRLISHPLAAETVVGQPLADGLGLESLVAQVAPLFVREKSLIRWVALRGAFTELFVRIFDTTSAVASPADFAYTMGMLVTDDGDNAQFDVAPPWRNTTEQRMAALGLFTSVLNRVRDYERYSKMNVADVNTDPRCQLPHRVALDCIAWSAIALLRLGVAQQVISQVPEPDALFDPGWFTDPLFAKAERYWDGSDWTGRCRVRDGQQYIETPVPLA